MAITHEDVNELKKVFDDRYVMIEDCKDTQQSINSKFSNDDKRIEKQEEFTAGLKKLGWTIISILASETVLSFLNLFKDVI